MSGLRSDMTIRHPKRGKSHRGVPARDLYSGGAYVATACGLPRGSAQQMTDVIPISDVDPAELCRVCFPGIAS